MLLGTGRVQELTAGFRVGRLQKAWERAKDGRRVTGPSWESCPKFVSSSSSFFKQIWGEGTPLSLSIFVTRCRKRGHSLLTPLPVPTFSNLTFISLPIFPLVTEFSVTVKVSPVTTAYFFQEIWGWGRGTEQTDASKGWQVVLGRSGNSGAVHLSPSVSFSACALPCPAWTGDLQRKGLKHLFSVLSPGRARAGLDLGPTHLPLPSLLHHSLISPQVTGGLGI